MRMDGTRMYFMHNSCITGASQGGNLRLYHLASPLRRKNSPKGKFFLNVPLMHELCNNKFSCITGASQEVVV